MTLFIITWCQDPINADGWGIINCIFGVPIMVLNAWEWFMPELMELYFGKGRVDNTGEDRP